MMALDLKLHRPPPANRLFPEVEQKQLESSIVCPQRKTAKQMSSFSIDAIMAPPKKIRIEVTDGDSAGTVD